MHCLTAWGRWGVQVLQCMAPLPGGSGQWNSYNALLDCLRSVGSGQCNSYHALPHCLGAVGNGNPAMHCLTTWGKWAVELRQCTASLLGVTGQCTAPLPATVHYLTAYGQWAMECLQHSASQPRGSGQPNSCNALPSPPRGSGRWNSCNALPHRSGSVGSARHHYLGAARSGTATVHYLTAYGQWAMECLQHSASQPRGSGQWNSCNALPSLPRGSGPWNSCNALPHCSGSVGSARHHYLGAARSGTATVHYLTAYGQWAMECLQHSASQPRNSGQWNSCNALPSLPRGSGLWNSCNALPHCSGSVGSARHHYLGAARSGTATVHYLTAYGQWAMECLQHSASQPRGSGQWNSCNALPSLPRGSGRWNSCNALPHCSGSVGSARHHYLGAARSGTATVHYLTAYGQWAMECLQHSASQPRGSGQWNSCNALPSLPRGSGQCNSCSALPHCLGVVGSGTHAMHRLTALGQWAVQFAQCIASPHGGRGQ